MKDFLKLIEADPASRNCKNCGYSVTLHHGKMEPINGMEKLSFDMKLLGCKKCKWVQFL
ncbi:hypothetical protein [Nitrosopumilus ureiphilus]|uniref:hypothetical protein n=1 Tax=Nitrosopumilus ureiphilus TaxID=1470067 RepID=UPI0015C90001|nr:hypothetical protein [Nitrosopumilus ureiphilus]